MIRIALGIGAFISALWGPWWLTLVLMVIISLLYSAWEVPVIGLIADLVWRPVTGFLTPFPVLFVISLVLVWLCEPLRKRFFVH